MGDNIPKPFNHIAGNCIVTKIPLPSDSCNANNNENSLSDEDLADLSEFGQCAKPPIRPSDPRRANQKSDSPLKLVNVQNGNISDPFPPGTYFGIVNIEKTPIVEDEQTSDDGDFLQ